MLNLNKLNTENLRSKEAQKEKNLMTLIGKDKPFWHEWQKGVKTRASNPFRTTDAIEKDVRRYPDISEERRLRIIAFPISERLINKLLNGIEKGLSSEEIFALLDQKETDLIYYLQHLRIIQPELI